jgi:hypothetical protein
MVRLSESASGLRHLRWAREILASLEAHFEHDARLDAAERDLVLAESIELRAWITELSAAVKAYRDFLERERTRFRGLQRVGGYLEASARGAEQRADALAVRAGFDEAFAAMEARERIPRKEALRAAVRGIRVALATMDERFLAALPPAFVESLYPALIADASRVLDGPDDDDDASGVT